MKKTMIIAGIVGIIIIFFGGWYFAFCHLGKGPAFPFLPAKELENGEITNVAENQLMAIVETEEEAEDIAKLYGIELTKFSDQVATYKTDEDPVQVVERGQEKGYPKLYINYVRATDEMMK